MNRLEFKLPEFTRVVWASAKHRESWEGKIRDIAYAWLQIERSTVGVTRRGALQSIKPENLLDFQAYCHHAQIEFAIIQQEGMSPVYGNASVPVIQGRPWQYRVYMGEKPKEFLLAWQDSDQRKIGEMLGYPECCTEFFLKYWTDLGWRDLTVPMLQNGPDTGPPTCNILLRHLGIRPVFHLPCSFACSETARVAAEIIQHGCKMGYGVEMRWLEQILSWSLQWSSLHGVAITTTPALKIIYSTDALAEPIELNRVMKTSMLDGIRDTWTDNGFASYGAMRQAHNLVLGTLSHVLLDSGRILDLGCGNGALLEQITQANPHLIPHGIEMDPVRARRAKERIGSNITQGNIFEREDIIAKGYQVVFISVNRFREVPSGKADLLLRYLRDHTKYLIICSYEPWEDWEPNHFSPVATFHDETSEVRIYRPR